MVNALDWKVGQKIVVSAQPFNHEDDREITLEYLGEGLLVDVDTGNRVCFDTDLFQKLFQGMNLPLRLVHNALVSESYKVRRILE